MSDPIKMIGDAELQLIQATLRMDTDGETAINTATRNPLDWIKLLNMTKRHGVIFQVHRRLSETTTDFIPARILNVFESLKLSYELHVFQMICDLVKVMRALEDAEIPAISMKGPALTIMAYGKPAMRFYGDLDILVKESDLPAATQVLLKLGASRTNPDKENDMVNTLHDNFDFGVSHIELHWKVTTPEFPKAMAVDELFAHSQMISIDGQYVRTFSDEDTILHLLHHGTHHCWSTLRHLTVLALVLRKFDAKTLQSTISSARSQGLYYPLQVGVGLTCDILGASYPDELNKHLKRNLRTRWAINIAKSVIISGQIGRPSFFEQTIFDILTADMNLFAAIRFIAIRLLYRKQRDEH
ncbi:MAG: nucleotidyltransferase family protein [bacterium]